MTKTLLMEGEGFHPSQTVTLTTNDQALVVRSVVFMALKTRVWGAGKLLLLAGALVATYLVFALASMRLALKTREVQVPDLTNRTANEATALASGMGLAVRVDDTRRSDAKIPAGNVLAQEIGRAHV